MIDALWPYIKAAWVFAQWLAYMMILMVLKSCA